MIKELIQKFGQEKAKAYLLNYFKNPEKIEEFPSLFPDHLNARLPHFQKEILHKIPSSNRLAIVAPRGSGKSTLINIPVMAWFSLLAESHFTVLISSTLPQARLHLDAIANEIETNPFIKWLFGEVKGKIWGSEMLIIESPFGTTAIVAKGAGQKIRGLKFRSYRPELVIIDDLEDDESVKSQDLRDKLEKWFRFNLLRGLSKKKNKIIYVGTLLDEKALLTRISQKKEPIFQSWDVLFYTAITENGESFWEEQFPIEYLRGIRDNPEHPDFVGELVFDQEMMNHPRNEKDRIIKPEWVDNYMYSGYEKDEKWMHSLEVYIIIDPAISQKEKSSDFALHTMGIDSLGHSWHLNTIRGKFSIEDQIKYTIDEYERWRGTCKGIGIESIAYQKVLSQLIRTECAKRRLYPNIKEIFTHKDKSTKMVSVSPRFQGGLVHLLREHKETPTLRDQLISFPQGNNDSADALAMFLEMTAKKKRRTFAKKPRIFYNGA